MNIILSMTLSGTVVFLLYRCLDRTKLVSFPPGIRYMIVKSALLFHIIPGGYLIEGIRSLLSFGHKRLPDHIFISGRDPFIAFTPEGPRANAVFIIHLTFFCTWLFIAAAVILWQIAAQGRLRKHIMNSSREITSGPALELLHDYQTKLRLKKKIRLYSSSAYAFTFGILHPLIVLPEIYEKAELEMTLYHELIHIKRNDPFIHFLRGLVRGIYWFNPLVFLICRETESFCEISCDELVTRNMETNDKAAYSRLIIKMASYAPKPSLKHVTAFSKNQAALKERIDFIMTNKKRKNKTALFLSMVLILCGTFPAFAYTPPQSLKFVDNEEEDIIKYAFLDAGEFSFNGYSKNIFIEDVANIVYDSQFTDSHGNIYNVDEPVTLENCEHNFEDGTYQKHVRNSSGGCVLKDYASKRCTKCGEVKTGTLISQHQYTICPH